MQATPTAPAARPVLLAACAGENKESVDFDPREMRILLIVFVDIRRVAVPSESRLRLSYATTGLLWMRWV